MQIYAVLIVIAQVQASIIPSNLCDLGKPNPTRKEGQTYGVNILPPGSLVRITSYSPFRGLKGTIRTVDTIADTMEEPFCYYLIELDGTQNKEPMWFEYDEVEVITSPLVAPQANA